MPKVPGNITVLTLTHAKGAELKYWIDGANREAGKRALTKSGRVEELRQRLAEHYGLNLSSPPSTLVQAGPPAMWRSRRGSGAIHERHGRMTQNHSGCARNQVSGASPLPVNRPPCSLNHDPRTTRWTPQSAFHSCSYEPVIQV
jgi:hypothetical protein